MSENQNTPIYITIVRDLLDIVLPNSAFSFAGYSFWFLSPSRLASMDSTMAWKKGYKELSLREARQTRFRL